MLPELVGDPQCGVELVVAEGSGVLMQRHIPALKQVANGHLVFDYDAKCIRGEYRYKEMHGTWQQCFFEVSYDSQSPAPNGTKITKLTVKVWSFSLGTLESRSMRHDVARANLLSFLFPNAHKGALMEIKLFPN
jgi:hypothetical protein